MTAANRHFPEANHRPVEAWAPFKLRLPLLPKTMPPLTMPGLRILHRYAFLITAATVLVCAASGAKLDFFDWPFAAALLILALGVPHGAFDAALADRHFHFDSRRRLVIFISAYAAIAMSVTLVWLMLPAAALCAFLAYSALHFSEDWAEDVEILPRAVIGAALVGLPAAGHPEQVAVIFGWIATPDITEAVLHYLRLAGIIAANASVVIVIAIAFRSLLAAVEIAAVLALAAIMPPLTYFLLYFCLMHSVRHTFDAYESLRPESPVQFVRSALPYVLAAAAAIVAGGLLVLGSEPGEALLSAVFIALAALTVPHMLLATHIDAPRGKLASVR